MNLFDLPTYDESKSDSEYTFNERLTAKKELEVLLATEEYLEIHRLESEYELNVREGEVYFK